jgi:hypothetical protein
MSKLGVAFDLAATAEANEALWSDPEGFGRTAGLRGADLAELVGAIRAARIDREEMARTNVITSAAFEAQQGADWPFHDADSTTFAQFVEITALRARSLFLSKAHGIEVEPSALDRCRAWATALLTEARARADDRPEHVEVAVADAIIAAQGLLAACE